ncbi:hypothetical protein CBR_g12479 [Chara braunii]|uniref:DUF4283 domain-containing protein n=1 Tax=Chara braunii TaxID=69332 RepID=A0A388JSH5_CHABU|nr:hypothetical protein CBR_g12479 [Chara braunii]|eukprot:GBG60741.1 hypothetical protein CBR_g12479 [Chara braunii]
MDREARSPPAAPAETEEDNERLRELARRCYEDGIMPASIDPGEMSGEGREVRFKVNRHIDQVKITWLKEHTVTIIFREGARFLSRKVKEDIMRAFEDERVADGSLRVADGSLDSANFRRGRVKVESPNVVSYVAKSEAVANWMILKGRDEITIGSTQYVFEFKPWLTKAQLRAQRQEEDKSTFWVVVPLDAFFYLEAQVAQAIGPVIRVHPAEQDRLKPAIINIKFEIDPAARANMRDKIWVDTCEGDALEVKLASAETPRCRRCRAFFHTEAECRRNRQQNQGATAHQGQSEATSRPQYQGILRPVGSQGANPYGAAVQGGGTSVSFGVGLNQGGEGVGTSGREASQGRQQIPTGGT